MIFRLPHNKIAFPNPALADDDGLLAYGGDLSEARLRLAYSMGIFPWYNEGEEILWFAPHERCVIFPARIKISKSMQQVLRRRQFTVAYDQDFGSIISRCAQANRKGQEGTWITAAMQIAYLRLHEAGVAHCVAVYEQGQLVGGLYGLMVNQVFCGESMFSTVPNASKAALIWLAQLPGLQLIDCQLPNPHLISMGAEMVSRDLFLQILQQ